MTRERGVLTTYTTLTWFILAVRAEAPMSGLPLLPTYGEWGTAADTTFTLEE